MKFEDIKKGQEYEATVGHYLYGYQKGEIYAVYMIDKLTQNITLSSSGRKTHYFNVLFADFDSDFSLRVTPPPLAAGAKHNNPVNYSNVTIRTGDRYRCMMDYKPSSAKSGDSVEVVFYDAMTDTVSFHIITTPSSFYSAPANDFLKHFTIVSIAPAPPPPPLRQQSPSPRSTNALNVIFPGDSWQCIKSIVINVPGSGMPLYIPVNNKVDVISVDNIIKSVTFIPQGYTSQYSLDKTSFLHHFSILYFASSVPPPAPAQGQVPPSPTPNKHGLSDDGEYDTKPLPAHDSAPLNDFIPEKEKLKNHFMSKKRLSD